ncbi:MAG: PEP/pyruvate-binding domain-containing protein, partial [Promethearchaeota archaeon]
MEPLIVNLEDVSKNNLTNIGSKASNLSRLIQSGFPVPKGFCVTTEAYSLFLESNNLNELIQKSLGKIDYSNYETIENCEKEIHLAIGNSTIPKGILEKIKLEYDKLYTTNVAVRSSATAEDLLNASFAGQYDTYLNLKTLDQVFQNVKNCYGSVWTSRAISYRHENNIPHIDVKLATIIQEMVLAKCAGILFTINPVSKNKNELIIESNFGLGESIVSGQSSPDQFTIQRERKNKFKILDKQIGKKNIAVYPKTSESESGITYRELSEQENIQPSLKNKEIIILSQIGTQIEKLFKIPQDIEWAIDQNDKIYLLQSRPITSLGKIDSEDDLYWTRGYSDDYWNDPCTPLFFDLLGDQITKVVNIELNSIMGYTDMDNILLKLYDGHVYFNLNVLKKKVEYEIPKYTRNEDLLNYFPEGSGPYGKETMKNLPFRTLKRIFSEIRIMMHDPDGGIKKTAEKYETWSENTFTPYCHKFDSNLEALSANKDLEGLIDLAKELDQIMIAHFRLIRYGIPVHNLGMNLTVRYFLTRFLGKEEASRLYPVLISKLENKLTETNKEIHKLASIVQNSHKLKPIIHDKKSEELYDYISSNKDPEIQDFFEKFKEFLNEYGDRGFSREVFYPRWSEAPQYIFDIIKSLTMGQENGFKRTKSDDLKYREKVANYAEAKIRSLRFGLIKWKLVSTILEFSRQYIIFREDQRFNLDRWIARNRKVYLEIGNILVEKRLFNESSDIFFLHKNEIKKMISRSFKADISSLIEKRRNVFFKFEDTIPPKFLHGNREFDDIFRYNKDSVSFKGIPASQGILTGKIRVLNKIEEITSVQAGEIVVVKRTDPGWTPIFSKIGGLI